MSSLWVQVAARYGVEVPYAAMSARPSFEEIYMEMATQLARRSTCRRLSVGCVITSADHRQVYSVGYNGNASGLANDCDSDAVGNCGDIHAEVNACISCVAPRRDEKVVYCTHLPCKMCAKVLIQLGGVRRVLFLADYRLQDAKAVFAQGGIECVPMLELLLKRAGVSVPPIP